MHELVAEVKIFVVCYDYYLSSEGPVCFYIIAGETNILQTNEWKIWNKLT